jgi:hypothetical protein
MLLNVNFSKQNFTMYSNEKHSIIIFWKNSLGFISIKYNNNKVAIVRFHHLENNYRFYFFFFPFVTLLRIKKPEKKSPVNYKDHHYKFLFKKEKRIWFKTSWRFNNYYWFLASMTFKLFCCLGLTITDVSSQQKRHTKWQSRKSILIHILSHLSKVFFLNVLLSKLLPYIIEYVLPRATRNWLLF